MNAREGMRRLGFVLGVLGSIAGAVIGYWDVQNAWSSHKEQVNRAIFDMNKGQEIAAPVGRNLPSSLQGKSNYTVPMIAPDGTLSEVPADLADGIVSGGKVGVWMTAPDGSVGAVPKERVLDAINDGGRPFGSLEALRQDQRINKMLEESGANRSPLRRLVNAFAQENHLALIARLLLAFCYPVIGFLVPWLTVKVLVWVGSGFFAPRSSA